MRAIAKLEKLHHLIDLYYNDAYSMKITFDELIKLIEEDKKLQSFNQYIIKYDALF